MERPQFRAKVNIAISTAVNVAITGRPGNSGNRRKAWPFGRDHRQPHASPSGITGTSDVQTLTPKPGISSSVRFFFSRWPQAFRDRLIDAFSGNGRKPVGKGSRSGSPESYQQQRLTHIGMKKSWRLRLDECGGRKPWCDGSAAYIGTPTYSNGMIAAAAMVNTSGSIRTKRTS